MAKVLVQTDKGFTVLTLDLNNRNLDTEKQRVILSHELNIGIIATQALESTIEETKILGQCKGRIDTIKECPEEATDKRDSFVFCLYHSEVWDKAYPKQEA